MFKNDFQKEIWKQNYKLPSERKVQDTWRRIATATASVEEDKLLWATKFYDLLEDFKFVPGGRINANIGVDDRKGTTLFNCYVHNPNDINYDDPDSITGIIEMLKKQALTLKSEGGYGMNFSWLRPAGTYIKGIGARTPGVLKFMELWDKSSEIITMGTTKRYGKKRVNEKEKIRKGAQMGVLNVWHPDIEEFITAKQTQGRLTKFNLSIGITNGFMKAVKQNEMWELKYPDTEFEKYKHEWKGDLDEWEAKGYPVNIYKKVKAKDLWDTIMLSTYNRNEPGVLFLDLANKLNTIPDDEIIQTSNPCVIGDTLVLTNIGWIKIKNLEEYKKKYIGLTIVTMNKDKQLYNSKLLKAFLTQKNDEIYRVYFNDNEYISTNYKHKLYGEYFNQICIGDIYDKYNNKEINKYPKIIGAYGALKKIIKIEKMDIKEDVYDLTAQPNYNFFSILNRDENIVTEKVIINNNLKFYIYDVVNINGNKQKFAIDLEENDEI